ncbi:MAG TPA: ATP-binding protein [Kaistia sp.]|nr:ATP-binding protein [Kaistia sp.]
MALQRTRFSSARLPIEARTGLVSIILVSSLAFLLLQARKDVLGSLAIHEARLALQFATVAAQPGIAEMKTVIDDPGRPPGDPSGLSPLPGQVTIAIPVEPIGMREPALALLGVNVSHFDDTGGRFVIRNGKLFAAKADKAVAVMTSAPVLSLADGLFGRLAIDIGCVVFLGSMLLLVRESRLSDYSVRRLLDASPVPLILIDAGGSAEYANAPALDLFDDSGQGSLTQLGIGLGRHEALYSWLVALPESGEHIDTREFAIASPARPLRRILVSRQSLIVRARRMIIASIVDITIRHEAEMALVKAKNVAEDLGRMKSESLAMISHELRTPVNGVLGLAQILAKQDLPEGAARIVRRMVEAGRTLGVIINDIVDLALLEIEHLRLGRRGFDPRETITAAVGLASAAAPEKMLTVKVAIMTPLPAVVFGDPARLQQVIVNLVGNGIKFTEAGRVEVRVDIARSDAERIELSIEVIDSGIGIAADVILRLFQPFSQAETGRARRYEGTGLGLAISKGLVEAMGGTISVTSVLGGGSTFRVRLPFGLLAATEEDEPPSVLARHILVVDDVALNRDVVADLLRAEGCEVQTVGSAEAAFEAIAAERFDIVLMDIRMPGTDGLAATRMIRAETGPHRHAGPILGLTANPAPTDRPLYLLSGIDGIVEKPVESERLRAMLRHQPAIEPPMQEPPRLSHLVARLGRERGLRIMLSFIEVAETAVEAIAEGCSRHDVSGISEHAHRLAGAASNVGFDALAAAAEELETVAATGSALSVSDAAVKVVAAHRSALAFARAFAEGKTAQAHQLAG